MGPSFQSPEDEKQAVALGDGTHHTRLKDKPPLLSTVILRVFHRLHTRCAPTLAPLRCWTDTLEPPDCGLRCLLPYTANTSLISFSITRSAASMPYVLAIAWMSLEYRRRKSRTWGERGDQFGGPGLLLLSSGLSHPGHALSPSGSQAELTTKRSPGGPRLLKGNSVGRAAEGTLAKPQGLSPQFRS